MDKVFNKTNINDKENIEYLKKYTKNNKKDIEFIKEFIQKEDSTILKSELMMWDIYKICTPKSLIYNIYSFKDFLIKEGNVSVINKLKNKMYKIEKNHKSRKDLERLIEAGEFQEVNLDKLENFIILRNEYLEYKNKYFKNKHQIHLSFEKYLKDEGDSIIFELNRLKREKQFKDILEKYNLEIDINDEMIQEYLIDEDIIYEGIKINKLK
jgi:hypothetical protein